ncbi:MarR family winged helix-turn-helix transcriptional regulator [Candidatus Omnitrophota bacterium]
MTEETGRPENADFGLEVAKILPLIIRESSSRMTSVFSEVNLTIPQLIVLELLIGKGECNMSDLAGALKLTMGAATGIVDKMVENNVVKRERSQNDRRVVNITIEDKGKEVVNKVNFARRDIINEVFSGLSEDEKSSYLSILIKVRDDLVKRYEK